MVSDLYLHGVDSTWLVIAKSNFKKSADQFSTEVDQPIFGN